MPLQPGATFDICLNKLIRASFGTAGYTMLIELVSLLEVACHLSTSLASIALDLLSTMLLTFLRFLGNVNLDSIDFVR